MIHLYVDVWPEMFGLKLLCNGYRYNRYHDGNTCNGYVLRGMMWGDGLSKDGYVKRRLCRKTVISKDSHIERPHFRDRGGMRTFHERNRQ